MLEGKDDKGFVWVQDLRNDDYYYLKDFEHLVVMKTTEFGESHLQVEAWEAVVFEDESCRTVISQLKFPTREEAQKCLESLVEVVLKNRKAT